MNAAGSEHGNLELYINRRSAPWLGPNSRHEIYLSIYVAFCLAGKSLDTPDDGLLFRLILGTSKGMLDFGLGSVFGDGNFQDNMSGVQLI